MSTDYTLKGVSLGGEPVRDTFSHDRDNEPAKPQITITSDEDENDEEAEMIISTRGVRTITINVWSAATIIFLLVGFIWNLWHPGWIVFLIPSLITVATNKNR